MVTIKRDELVEMLKAIGFADAVAWDDTKLAIRAPQVPKRFTLEQIPEAHWKCYAACVVAENTNDVVSIEASKDARKAQTKAREAQRTKEKIMDKVVLDVFGCREGTISYKVDKVLLEATTWLDEKEIADIAGVTLEQARGRLYFAMDEGQFLFRQRREYKINPDLKKNE